LEWEGKDIANWVSVCLAIMRLGVPSPVPGRKAHSAGSSWICLVGCGLPIPI
jgi:hypothetical protein